MLSEEALRERLQPTFDGVDEEIARIRADVARGYYVKRLSRLAGIRRRSASTAKAKYDRIAGTYRQSEAARKDDDRSLAFVDDTPCFVIAKALAEYHRHRLAREIDLVGAASLLEVGAGELNTLLPVVDLLRGNVQSVTALDISSPRLEVGRKHDGDALVSAYVAGSAGDLPFADKSVDVIFTSHCLEQSPELVGPALKEFARVARRRIILAEPAYELAHPLQRKRIRKIGYARGIASAARRLGLTVITHELMPVRQFLNGSALTVIRP